MKTYSKEKLALFVANDDAMFFLEPLVDSLLANGLTAAQIEEARQFMSRLGNGNARITHPTTTLEELFVRVVQTNTPGNGKGG